MARLADWRWILWAPLLACLLSHVAIGVTELACSPASVAADGKRHRVAGRELEGGRFESWNCMHHASWGVENWLRVVDGSWEELQGTDGTGASGGGWVHLPVREESPGARIVAELPVDVSPASWMLADATSPGAQSCLAVAVGFPSRAVVFRWESDVRWLGKTPPFPEPMREGSLWQLAEIRVIWLGVLLNLLAILLATAALCGLLWWAQRWSSRTLARRKKFELLVPRALLESAVGAERVSWLSRVGVSFAIVLVVWMVSAAPERSVIMTAWMVGGWCLIYTQSRLDPRGGHRARHI